MVLCFIPTVVISSLSEAGRDREIYTPRNIAVSAASDGGNFPTLILV
jgi:hypothetical protein